jgi:two-component system response regulator HydG
VGEAARFLVVVRPADWPDFTRADRVLLQLICQIWVRGQARAIQVQDLHRENAQLKQKAGVSMLLGDSPATKLLRERAAKSAATNVTVLLHGETGSGKEVVAQFIHQHSPRKDEPFIKVNCAAIPDTLIESELFGHMKGAFTDARRDRKGKFAQAHNGTILLDEIGEMPLSVQAKVLRAIENREIEPVGSEAIVNVNVRIIAATNRDLLEMAKAKQFREDLFHRLNVVPVTVPPLRERLEDIGLLAAHFLEQFCLENGLAEMSFAPDAISQLQRYSWPGNVRELRNVVQRCAASAEAALITGEALKSQLQI